MLLAFTTKYTTSLSLESHSHLTPNSIFICSILLLKNPFYLSPFHTNKKNPTLIARIDKHTHYHHHHAYYYSPLYLPHHTHNRPPLATSTTTPLHPPSHRPINPRKMHLHPLPQTNLLQSPPKLHLPLLPHGPRKQHRHRYWSHTTAAGT